MPRPPHARLSVLMVLAIGLVTAQGLPATPTTESATPESNSGASQSGKVIFFAADGMRPGLVDKYAAFEFLPTMSELMKSRVRGDGGLQQGLPPNAGVGWYNPAAGTWPSQHGSTNNTFHRVGDHFWNAMTFATLGVLQADTITQGAERAGKTVVSIEWVGVSELDPPLQGPIVDFRTF